MVSNLPDIQKTDWVNSDIVMPADTNAWGTAINILANDIPLYAHTGNFYTATYSDNIYTLTPLTGNATLSAYTNGMSVSFFCPAANLDSCKVKIGSLSAVNIKDMNNIALVQSSLRQGELVSLIYDSANSCFKVSALYASTSLDNLNSVGSSKILPAQSSSVNGYFLKTNGTTASWVNLTAANLTFTGNNTFSGTNSFTGGVTATTQAYGTNNTSVATTAFVKASRNVNWGSSVSVTSPTSSSKYTAPYDGVYITTVYLNNKTNVQLNINGTNTAISYSDNATGCEHQAFYIPLSSGDVIYWTEAVSTRSSRFYKYKR